MFCFAVAVSAQHDVYRTDGTEYKNVFNLQDADSFFLFDKDGKNYSIPKHRIRKIQNSDGKIVFEQQKLIARIVADEEGNKYIFLKNGAEAGRGWWLDAGKFLVTEGKIHDGIYKEFYDSGEEKRTFSFVSGSLNGICKVFYRSGKVEREGFFKNGKEEGESKLFYPKGALKGISYYKNGVKNGPTKLYYKSEKIRAEMRFKDGRPDGEQLMLYENGKPESKVVYSDGIKNGAVNFYYESGKTKLQGKYVDGFLDGTVTTYYESGRVKKRKIFNNGRILQQ